MNIRSARVLGAVAMAILMAAAGCDSGDPDAPAGQIGAPVSSALLDSLQATSRQGLTRNVASPAGVLQQISGPSLSEDKPVILYIGADYCPYCAALRWPLVLAMLRFGTFEDLRYMRSSSHDVYADTATFSFHGMHYHSDYLDFEAIDIADRAGQPLDRPDDGQLAVFQKFDAAPYTNVPGAIPFLYIGGGYLQVGTFFTPDLLQGRSWRQIADQSREARSSLSGPVMAAANLYTAAFCSLTEQKPSDVCHSPAIEEASRHLPH